MALGGNLVASKSGSSSGGSSGGGGTGDPVYGTTIAVSPSNPQKLLDYINNLPTGGTNNYDDLINKPLLLGVVPSTQTYEKLIIDDWRLVLTEQYQLHEDNQVERLVL